MGAHGPGVRVHASSCSSASAHTAMSAQPRTPPTTCHEERRCAWCSRGGSVVLVACVVLQVVSSSVRGVSERFVLRTEYESGASERSSRIKSVLGSDWWFGCCREKAPRQRGGQCRQGRQDPPNDMKAPESVLCRDRSRFLVQQPLHTPFLSGSKGVT